MDGALPGSEIVERGIEDLARGVDSQDSAHSRYNALIRRLVSFERAAERAAT